MRTCEGGGRESQNRLQRNDEASQGIQIPALVVFIDVGHSAAEKRL